MSRLQEQGWSSEEPRVLSERGRSGAEGSRRFRVAHPIPNSQRGQGMLCAATPGQGLHSAWVGREESATPQQHQQPEAEWCKGEARSTLAQGTAPPADRARQGAGQEGSRASPMALSTLPLTLAFPDCSGTSKPSWSSLHPQQRGFSHWKEMSPVTPHSCLGLTLRQSPRRSQHSSTQCSGEAGCKRRGLGCV